MAAVEARELGRSRGVQTLLVMTGEATPDSDRCLRSSREARFLATAIDFSPNIESGDGSRRGHGEPRSGP